MTDGIGGRVSARRPFFEFALGLAFAHFYACLRTFGAGLSILRALLSPAHFYAYACTLLRLRLRKCLPFGAWAYASNSAMMRAMAPSSQETVIRSATALTRSEALATA